MLLDSMMNPLLDKLSSEDRYALIDRLKDWECYNPEFILRLNKWFFSFGKDNLLALKILKTIRYYSAAKFNSRLDILRVQILQYIYPDNLSKVLLVTPAKHADSAERHAYDLVKNWSLTDSQVVTTNELGSRDITNHYIVAFNDTYGTARQFLREIWPTLSQRQAKRIIVAGITVCEKALKEFERLPNVDVLNQTAERTAGDVFSKAEYEKIKAYGDKVYRKHPLGYGGCEILVAYYFQCPNNTLPIIWADGLNNKCDGDAFPWTPLFAYNPKRAEVIDAAVSKSVSPKTRKKIKTPVPTARPLRTWRWQKSALGLWQDKLNEAFVGDAQIVSILRTEPQLEAIGSYRTPSKLARQIDRFRRRYGEPGSASNQYHAILRGEPIHSDGTIVFRYAYADYATMRAFEHVEGRALHALYAGALVCCSASRRVFLHRRSAIVDKAPNSLHIMAGNFIAKGRFMYDTHGLKATARREIHEEMNVSIDVSASRYPALLTRDIRHGAWIVLYLGVDISKSEAKKIIGSGEGEPEAVLFNDLGKTLEGTKNWVRAGELNLLAWLALGAVTVGAGPGFDETKAIHYVDGWLSRRGHK